MTQWWSWLLTAIGVTGLYLAGRKSKAGWAVGFAAQALWIAYAVATRQWGFIFSALAYGSVYARNWLRWRRDAAIDRHDTQGRDEPWSTPGAPPDTRATTTAPSPAGSTKPGHRGGSS